LIIKLEDLTYTYSQGTPFEKTAVDHVDLEIEEGTLVGIIGHTGSGKSTLIQHLNGLIKPTSGKVYIDGEDIHAKGVDLKKIRFSPVDLSVLKRLNLRHGDTRNRGLGQQFWSALKTSICFKGA
jgi:ABC-type multidrug transport system ATPase subunit